MVALSNSQQNQHFALYNFMILTLKNIGKPISHYQIVIIQKNKLYQNNFK